VEREQWELEEPAWLTDTQMWLLRNAGPGFSQDGEGVGELLRALASRRRWLEEEMPKERRRWWGALCSCGPVCAVKSTMILCVCAR